MAEDITPYISTRTKCPLCLSTHLSEGIKPHINLPFPLLPVCVDTPKEEDHFVNFTIGLCNDCGLIMLKEIVDPEILYKIFHSDGIGKVWEQHYARFAQLIKKYHKTGRILEIGAGQGKLIAQMLNYYDKGVEVMDPLYFGPREKVVVHPTLFTQQSAEQFKGQFDAIVSSHTLEHFVEFKEYFENSWKALKPGGLLFTSIPNQESSFSKGYGNMLNFEHPSVCTNVHWYYLHYKYGFMIKEISFYHDHSVQIVAEKIATPITYNVDVKELSQKILEQYQERIQERIRTVNLFARPDKENWIFGASNFTQPLFMYGLDESVFKGVLDNSPLKHNKRLYGTSLICKKPEDVLHHLQRKFRVFLNLGQYNKEVFEQIQRINADVECIFL